MGTFKSLCSGAHDAVNTTSYSGVEEPEKYTVSEYDFSAIKNPLSFASLIILSSILSEAGSISGLAGMGILKGEEGENKCTCGKLFGGTVEFLSLLQVIRLSRIARPKILNNIFALFLFEYILAEYQNDKANPPPVNRLPITGS